MYCTVQLRHDRLHGIQSLGVVASACIHKLSYPHKPAFDSFYLLLGMFKKTLDLCELTVDSIIYIGDGNLARLVYAFECTSLRFDRKGRRFFTCQTGCFGSKRATRRLFTDSTPETIPESKYGPPVHSDAPMLQKLDFQA